MSLYDSNVNDSRKKTQRGYRFSLVEEIHCERILVQHIDAYKLVDHCDNSVDDRSSDHAKSVAAECSGIDFNNSAYFDNNKYVF